MGSAVNTFGPLVEAPWLAAHLSDPNLRVIDFRWREDQPGRPGYKAGHIPGAVRFDIDADASREEIEALVAQSQKRSAVFDIMTNPTRVVVAEITTH